jgi:hypothetical protein
MTDGVQCDAWKCVSLQLAAEISCSPATADIGTDVAVAYTCTEATSSKGNGFDSGGKLSGTATISLNSVPGNAGSANYSITCINSGRSTTSTCSVQIARPAISFVAQPPSVVSGATTTLGWTTRDMQSCVVSSPDQADFTERNKNAKSTTGVATSSPITGTTQFVLDCTTRGGAKKTATTTVVLTSSTQVEGTTTSGFDGATVGYAASTTIEWQFATSSDQMAVALWLYDAAALQPVSLIKGAASTTGSYAWSLPAEGAACPQDSPLVCAADLVDGRTYYIEAALYTPPDAYLGGLPQPGKPDPIYTGHAFTPSPFTFKK